MSAAVDAVQGGDTGLAPSPAASAYLPSGLHVIADLRGIDPRKAADAAWLAAIARRCAESAGARVLSVEVHGFGPGQGIAGVALLAESHLSFHTWPEHGFAALDAFMCGRCDPEAALRQFAQALDARELTLRRLQRGG